MVEPVRGVDKENYATLGKAFIIANEGTGFFIVRDAIWATSEFPHTPREWGAWMEYLDSKRISRRVFYAKGQGTVPAQWPHQFDADWLPGNDEQAADIFEAKLARENRAASIKATAKGIPYEPKARTQFIPEPDKQPSLIDKDLLFECHSIDVAKLKQTANGLTDDKGKASEPPTE